MKEIVEIVDQYINKTNTNYSIMINGEWGSGKTHFVLNDLKKHIENLKGYDNKPFKLIHISLSGLTKLEWITEQVILARLPLNKASRVGYGITKSAIELFGGTSLQKATLFSANKIRKYSTTLFDFHDCIIVFDDLERIDRSLNINSVLGYINTNFIEQHFIKVILVANTKKLALADSTDFSEIQEKSIDRIMEYKQDLNTMLMSYIKSFLSTKLEFDKFIKYIERDFDEIIRMINIANCKNLRTIRFVFEIFSTVCQSYNKHVDDQISRAIFMFILTLSQEFKNGILPLSENLEEGMSKLSLSSYLITNEFKKMKKDKSNSEPLYYEKFFGKYYVNTRVEWKYSKSILNFVLSGILDKELFLNELNVFTKESNEWDIKLGALFDYKYLEIDELSHNVEKVLTYSAQGKYFPMQYKKINDLLDVLVEKEYIELSNDYNSILISGLEKSLVNYPDFFNLSNEFSIPLTETQGGEASEFEGIINRHQIEFVQKRKVDFANEFFAALSDTDNDFFSTQIWKRINSNIEVFATIPSQLFVENMLKYKNNSLQIIIIMFHERIIRILNAGEVYYKMKQYLDGLSKELDEKLPTVKLDPMKRDILNQVVIKLKECVEHLEVTKRPSTNGEK